MSAADLAVEEWIEKSAVSHSKPSPSIPVVSRRHSHRVKDLRSAMVRKLAPLPCPRDCFQWLLLPRIEDAGL
jgi:hypothetical protein